MFVALALAPGTPVALTSLGRELQCPASLLAIAYQEPNSKVAHQTERLVDV
jgi:hypothetical protein